MSTSSTSSPSLPSRLGDISGDSDNKSGLSHAANYFFGFLITFVVLLIIFVACGIGTRRRMYIRRRAQLMENLEPWTGLRDGGVDVQPPKMYELPFSHCCDHKWDTMEPLSAVIIRKPEAASPVARMQTPSSTSINTTITSSIPHLPYISRPSWLLGARHQQKAPADPPSDTAPKNLAPVEALEVAVIVQMPTRGRNEKDKFIEAKSEYGHERTRSASESRSLHIPEYQIGVTREQWVFGDIKR